MRSFRHEALRSFRCDYLPDSGGVAAFTGSAQSAFAEWPQITSAQKGLGSSLVWSNWRQNPFDEWVYNSRNVDTPKVVWAKEMDSAHNLELMHYYADRKVRLVEPDSMPATVSPHPANQDIAGYLH